jgi:hypothetical protein
MTAKGKPEQNRATLYPLAEKPGNLFSACLIQGVSRRFYYKKAFQEHGFKLPIDLPPAGSTEVRRCFPRHG